MSGESKSGENMFENIESNIRQIQSNIRQIESRINKDDETIRSSVRSSRSQASVDKIMASSEYFDDLVANPRFSNGKLNGMSQLNNVQRQGENMRDGILELFQSTFPNSIKIANSDLDNDDINIVLQEAAITIGRLVRIKQEMAQMQQEENMLAINDKIRAIIEGISHEIISIYLQLVDKAIEGTPALVANVTSLAFLSTLLSDDIIGKFPDGRVKDTIRGLKIGLSYVGNGVAIKTIIDKIRSHLQLEEISVDYINDTIVRPLVQPTIQCAGICSSVLSSVNNMASTVLSKVGKTGIDVLAWTLGMGKSYENMEIDFTNNMSQMSQLSDTSDHSQSQSAYPDSFASFDLHTQEGVAPVAPAFPVARIDSNNSTISDSSQSYPVQTTTIQGRPDLSMMTPVVAEVVREGELTNEEIRKKYQPLTKEQLRKIALKRMIDKPEAAPVDLKKKKLNALNATRKVNKILASQDLRRETIAEKRGMGTDDESIMEKGGKRRRYGKSRRHNKSSKPSKKRHQVAKKGGRKTKRSVHKKTMKRHRRK
jgi:hypothetical protein